jgi:hypothetical protein
VKLNNKYVSGGSFSKQMIGTLSWNTGVSEFNKNQSNTTLYLHTSFLRYKNITEKNATILLFFCLPIA